MGLASDKPPAVSIPESESAPQARSPSLRHQAPTPPPTRAARYPRRGRCRDGVRVLRREGALRRRFPPLRLPGVRASPRFLPLLAHCIAVVLARRVVSGSGFGKIWRVLRGVRGRVGGLGAPRCVDLAVDSLICEVWRCEVVGSAHVFSPLWLVDVNDVILVLGLVDLHLRG